ALKCANLQVVLQRVTGSPTLSARDTSRDQQRQGAGIKRLIPVVDLAGDFLAQFYAKLVKRINPQQNRVHECAVLIEGNDGAQGQCIKIIRQKRRTWTITFVMT